MIYIAGIQAQNMSIISGIVTDSQNDNPIENAEIFLVEKNMNIFTDVNGYFKFSKLSENNYTLMVKHIGFEDFSTTVKLNQEEHKKLAIKLNPRPQYLKEIIIEGDIYKDQIISKLPYIETKITKKQVEESAARDVGDFLRSYNNISGIRKGGTQLDPVVRGFKYSQLNVQVDNGLKIEGGCPNRMDPATGHIETEDIETIEVFKGPYALRYGPSFGGVINMKTISYKTTDTANIHVHAMSGYESNWNGNKQQIGIKGGNKFLFFNISGGRKDYGNYKDGNGNEVKSEFSKYNYRGKIGIRPVKNHLFVFNYDESKGRDLRFPTLPMDELLDDTRLMSFDYSASTLSNNLNSINLKIYRSDVRHEMDNKNRPFSDTVVAISTIKASNQGARAETNISVGKGNLSLGIDYEQIRKDGERVKTIIIQPGLPVKKEKLWNNALINNVGIFGEYLVRLKTFEIIGAARIDINEAKSDEITIQHSSQGEIYSYGTDSIKSNFTNFSISLGVTKTFNKGLSLSMALGRGVRSPDMIERFIILLPIGYDKFDYLGNPKLKPEANNQVDLTLKYMNPKIGLLQVNGFYSLVNDYITGKILPPSVQKPLSKDVLGVKQFYNAGNARLRGFEFSYATPVKFELRAQLFASYTYATLDKVNKYVLNDQGQVVDEVELTNDALTEIPPLESTLILYYKLFKGKFTPKAKLRVVAAQNHISEASYEQETPGFMVAGLSFSFIFNKYFNLSAGVDNLFDDAYYEHLNRNIIGSNTNLYEPGRVFYFNLMFNI
jgi:iron complex outermembrane receptor protein